MVSSQAKPGYALVKHLSIDPFRDEIARSQGMHVWVLWIRLSFCPAWLEQLNTFSAPMCDASPLCRTTLRTNSFSPSKKQRQMQHAAHPYSVSKRCLLTDWEWIWWHPVWTLGLCLSPWCRPHTYFPVWCCPRINCTLLSWDDIQATKRQQGQWGLEEKVSVAHKTKRHLRFNKINKCCWKDLLGLSRREREGTSSILLALLSHKWKAPESLARNCKKALWKMSTSFLVISLGPLEKEPVPHFHCPNYLLWGLLRFLHSSHLIHRKLTLDSSGTISSKKPIVDPATASRERKSFPFLGFV